MTTHQVIQRSIGSMKAMMRVIDTVLKIDKKGGGDTELAAYRKEWQKSIDALEVKEKEIRPLPALINWEKGQAEASKNYNPPAHKPLC